MPTDAICYMWLVPYHELKHNQHDPILFTCNCLEQTENNSFFAQVFMQTKTLNICISVHKF